MVLAALGYLALSKMSYTVDDRWIPPAFLTYNGMATMDGFTPDPPVEGSPYLETLPPPDREDRLSDPYREELDTRDCNCGVVRTGRLDPPDVGIRYLGIWARDPSRRERRGNTTRMFMADDFF